LLGEFPVIFSGEHIFTLHPINGGALMEQSEVYRGLLVPFIGKAISASRVSFQAHSTALKKQIETG
jgi:hypothetical protein